MKRAVSKWIAVYWGTAALTLGVAVGLMLFYAPVEATMGSIQKIFYVHLPSAINTFVACAVVFVASIGYLGTRKDSWDDLAAAAAKVAVVFCSIVLITGMFWAKQAWGTWWTWSPRLTFSLLLWLLYVVYLINRSSIDSGRRRAVVSAVYGVVAFLDVPLVYLSARLLPDIHPTAMSMDVRMKLTLAFWFIPITLVNAGFIAAGYAIERRWRSGRRARDVEGPRPMKLELLRGGLA
jgi:heme exporter protein C